MSGALWRCKGWWRRALPAAEVEEARTELRAAAETKEAMEKSVATMVQTMQQALRADAEQGAGVVSTSPAADALSGALSAFLGVFRVFF